MLKKLSSIYTKIINLKLPKKTSVEFSALKTENAMLKTLCSIKDKENEILKDRIKEGLIPNLSYNQGDKSPVDIAARKQYVTAIRVAYEDWMKNKFEQMIVSCQKLLSDPSNPKDLDRVLKGAIYAYSEILHWAESMSAEAMSYDVGEKEENINN